MIRDGTWAPCIGNSESQSLDLQASLNCETLEQERLHPSFPLAIGAMKTMLMGDISQKKGYCVGFNRGRRH